MTDAAKNKKNATAKKIGNEALAYFRNKKNKPSFDWRDVAPEEHAFVFTVAKATKLDVLNTIREEVDAAIANGETLAMFQAKLKPRLIALGWWGKQAMVDPMTGAAKEVQLGSPRRLKTIYWSNIRAANAAGAWERAQKTKDFLPILVYNLGPSKHHRPEHAALEGKMLPVDDAFWKKYYPPNGWGCNCWTRQMTLAEATQLGYDPKAPAPNFGTVVFLNRRTGEERPVPRGIDPGWDSNAGLLRQENLDRFLKGQLQKAAPELRLVAARDKISRGK